MWGVRVGVVNDECKSGDGGAHALLIRILERCPKERRVGVDDRGDEVGEVWVDYPVGVSADRRGRAGVANSVDRYLAGYFAGFASVHAVGNDEKPAAGVAMVFVLFPHTTRVNGETPGEAGGRPDRRLCRIVT